MSLIRSTKATDDLEQIRRIAEEQFEAAIVAMGELARQAELGAASTPRDAKAIGESLRRAIEHLLSERQRLAEQSRKQAGLAGSYGLDLEAARSEVRRRMARLRAAYGE